MTVQELIAEIRRLPMEERLLLLESLSRDIRESLRPRVPKGSSLERVLGMLAPDGPLPTDEALRDAYADYLTEKYT
jgi:hypothetical protein